MASRRRPGHILPFRIPFFRIFYSTTYTTIYIICLGFLLITPASMIYQAVQQRALQYVVLIGGTYVLLVSCAIFIYASRLYTNRTVLAAIGKTYVPVEAGEVGKSVRKMIVKQYERSAIVAWESRPRDLLGEIWEAEQMGLLAPDTASVDRNDYTVGREIPIDPAAPPWGDVRHEGWSSPAHRDDGEVPNIQFMPVIKELPNLIEAKAVSLAPADPLDRTLADPVVLEVLRRPETMGLREYLTQLSYLGIIRPPEAGEVFLVQYEFARFGGLPLSEPEFKRLMSAFAELLSGMANLKPDIIDQIRIQTKDDASSMDARRRSSDNLVSQLPHVRASSPLTPESIEASAVTARTGPSRSVTPRRMPGTDGLSPSKMHVRTEAIQGGPDALGRSPSLASSSLASDLSDSGSVLRHRSSPDNG